MTNEELETIEARGADPLNSCEDARDGLETLGDGVVRLSKELRDERAMSERWRALAEVQVIELEAARAETRLWKALAQARMHDGRRPFEALAHDALRAAGIDPDAP